MFKSQFTKQASEKEFTINRVSAFRPEAPCVNPELVHINCPTYILAEFQHILRDSPILGAFFTNPYTGEKEVFPQNPDDLTVRHLECLARNEKENTSGIMKVELYNGLLTPDQIARIRCLVKSVTIGGLTAIRAYGGFGCPKVAVASDRLHIVVDQAGLQWQGDLHNTGGLYFYPAPGQEAHLPADYKKYQSDMFRVIHGYERPQQPSDSNKMPITWYFKHNQGIQISGELDLSLLEQAISIEFCQALEAVVDQGKLLPKTDNRKIYFKFLKAGMGYFADGIIAPKNKTFQLEKARLIGILNALNFIQGLPPAEQSKALGTVKCIGLPFSDNDKLSPTERAEMNKLLSDIQRIIVTLGLKWGGAGCEDALEPSKLYPEEQYIVATTNCGDPHAFFGNEGLRPRTDGLKPVSVDGAVSDNVIDPNSFNPAFNLRAQKIESNDFRGAFRPIEAAEKKLTKQAPEEEFTIEAISAFQDDTPIKNAGSVHINCPAHILAEFQHILRDSPILGTFFTNPYTGKKEVFPKNPDDLTVRHLECLARNEKENTTGIMKVELYNGLLTPDQIARIRCLVKNVTIGGLTAIKAYGGYNCPKVAVSSDRLHIVVDQAGLQWQGDLRNTGGLYFYPEPGQEARLPAGYEKYQSEMFRVIHGYERPQKPSSEIGYFYWKYDSINREIEGRIDIKLLDEAFSMEFRQALEAVVEQGKLLPKSDDSKIYFKFLKAGLGSFAAGIAPHDSIIGAFKLEKSRLTGILNALQCIQKLQSPSEALGNIKCISLPYSGYNKNFDRYQMDGLNRLLSDIETVIVNLGLEWGGVNHEDALSPKEGYIVATTNCGDPHAFFGNEGLKMVDGQLDPLKINATISDNVLELNSFNPAYNLKANLIVSHDFRRIIKPDGLSARFALFTPPPPSPLSPPPSPTERRDALIQTMVDSIVTIGCFLPKWFGLGGENGLRIGRGNQDGMIRLDTNQYAIQMPKMTVLEKVSPTRYEEVTDLKNKDFILNTVYQELKKLSDTNVIKLNLLTQKITQITEFMSDPDRKDEPDFPILSTTVRRDLKTMIHNYKILAESIHLNTAVPNNGVDVFLSKEGTTLFNGHELLELFPGNGIYTKTLRLYEKVEGDMAVPINPSSPQFSPIIDKFIALFEGGDKLLQCAQDIAQYSLPDSLPDSQPPSSLGNRWP